ncbi:MAG TPA: AMP-binding protein [Solirubrobacteraceae bacterium]
MSDTLTSLPLEPELDERARRLAAGLEARGVGAGDRVAVWLPNVQAWLELELALARLGAIAVAVNTRFRAREAQDVVDRSGARLLVHAPACERVDAERVELGPAYEALLDHPPLEDDRADPDAACNVFTSSGTTGLPKLVVHRQGGIVAHSRAVADAFGYRADDAVVLAMLPLCGVFGFNTALGALAGGARLVLLEEFDADAAVRLIDRERVTHTNGSLEMLRRVLAAGDVPSLREAGFAAFSGDARALVDAGDRLGKRFYQCYGSSEVQALMAHAPAAAPAAARALAGGPPVSGAIAVRVSDEGELEVRGPHVLAGYLGDEVPDVTDDGFFRTGDIAEADAERGFVYVARAGDALRLGGYLVSPREIEAFLEEQPGVQAAQVVGVEADGQTRAVAFAVGDFAEDAVLERCRAELARFKVPRRVLALDAFPTTPSANGERVRRGELRRLGAEALGADVA